MHIIIFTTTKLFLIPAKEHDKISEKRLPRIRATALKATYPARSGITIEKLKIMLAIMVTANIKNAIKKSM